MRYKLTVQEKLIKFIKSKNKSYGDIQRFCDEHALLREHYYSMRRSVLNKRLIEKEKRKIDIIYMLNWGGRSENQIAKEARCSRSLVQYYKRKYQKEL